MIGQFKISEFGDFVLKFLDSFILELFDFATIHTDQMVVVTSAVQFKNRIAAFKVMPLH